MRNALNVEQSNEKLAADPLKCGFWSKYLLGICMSCELLQCSAGCSERPDEVDRPSPGLSQGPVWRSGLCRRPSYADGKVPSLGLHLCFVPLTVSPHFHRMYSVLY